MHKCKQLQPWDIRDSYNWVYKHKLCVLPVHCWVLLPSGGHSRNCVPCGQLLSCWCFCGTPM